MVRWRVNGFEKPHTLDQMFTWIIYPLITAAYYFIFAFNIKEWERYLYLLLPHSFVVILLLICWFAVEYIDPSDSPGKTGIPVVCFRPLEVKARYCGNCRKLVYGLDHHCTWLNTCVGRRNYVPFFTLVVAGTIQLIIEVHSNTHAIVCLASPHVLP